MWEGAYLLAAFKEEINRIFPVLNRRTNERQYMKYFWREAVVPRYQLPA
jgi:hypothetical protein